MYINNIKEYLAVCGECGEHFIRARKDMAQCSKRCKMRVYRKKIKQSQEGI